MCEVGGHEVDSIIDAFKIIQVTCNTALSELEELKQDIAHERAQTDTSVQWESTKAQPREAQGQETVKTKEEQKPSPDTNKRNTGRKPLSHHTDNVGNKIKVGNTVKVLSTGLFRGDIGRVTKLGKARVLIKLTLGRNTNRKSSILRVIVQHV